MDIIARYPQFKFLPAGYFSYDSSDEIINYDPVELKSTDGKIALLHEIAHCSLGHFHFRYDIELLVMEAQAWHLTRDLAKKHQLSLSENYVEECLQTYSDWLQKRATCPICSTFSMQAGDGIYLCYSCNSRWRVNARIDQPVRRSLIR